MIIGKKEIQFSLSQPKLVGKAKDTLQFSLLLVDVDSGRNILELKGWTIKNYKIDPPSTRSFTGKYFPMIVSSERFLDILGDVTRNAWKEQFPTVLFPIHAEGTKGQSS